ncbi:NAD(P)-binding protein [Eremomyces bilateralis CBS 781.70]|uniref:NAD(P)-binding protein n=1 Tax=Eremomyces bilateralis CBS 781.70 TaxID=1392243 RepID=A0A6G1GBK6_9PEZI|nr:NAD(P)-binding protein [Eremomyces bilateralis CBS 781.70]KAF1815478.1 NAD(P)-binding protein [Eremomyces bilateralis CBS 781.70]
MQVGDFPIKDKVVVVTGGGSGICFEFVKKAIEAGAKVLIADLKLTTQAQTWFNEVQDKRPVAFATCDVTKWSDLRELVDASRKHFNAVPDVWVPGAGVFEPKWSNFWDDLETERYQEVDINVNHPIKLTRIAMQALAEADKKGVVLSVASIAGLSGTYSSALYVATKHAVVGFTRSMALADKYEGIKIVTICPGVVKTPLWTDRDDYMKQFGISDKLSLTPEYIADTMMDIIQQGRYPGGTVLEVRLEGTRVIHEWNNPVPESLKAEIPKEFIEHNIAPMRAIMDSYRKKPSS